MSYDEFESTMQIAGWSLVDIEAMWQDHLLDVEIENDERVHLSSFPAIDA